MGRFVVMNYDGAQKPIGRLSGEFASMDSAVAALSGPGLIKVGSQADLRAIAWEEGETTAPKNVAYYVARFVGADSE